MIKSISINGQLLNVSNILTTDTVHIIKTSRTNHSGYILYSDGWCIQYGMAALQDCPITLQYAYDSTQYKIFISNFEGNIDSDISERGFAYHIISNSQFTVLYEKNIPTDGFVWMTFGYIN